MTLVRFSRCHSDISPLLATIRILCSPNAWLKADVHSCCYCEQTILFAALCCSALCAAFCCALPNLHTCLTLMQWLLLAALRRRDWPEWHECDMPAQWSVLLQLCLQWDPAERASMQQLADFLEQCQD